MAPTLFYGLERRVTSSFYFFLRRCFTLIRYRCWVLSQAARDSRECFSRHSPGLGRSRLGNTWQPCDPFLHLARLGPSTAGRPVRHVLGDSPAWRNCVSNPSPAIMGYYLQSQSCLLSSDLGGCGVWPPFAADARDVPGPWRFENTPIH